MKKIKFNKLPAIFTLLLSAPAIAQDTAPAGSPAVAGNPNQTLYYLVGALLILILFLVLTLLRLVKLISEQHYQIIHGKPMEITQEPEKEDWTAKAWKKLTASVPKGIEKDVMLDHNYDGIHELDNRMPPWLQYIFFTTITFAAIYLLVFQVYHIGKNPTEEYAAELKSAQEQKAMMLQTAGSSIDESSAKQLTDAASLSAGKVIFISKCSPCHGQLGEGNVGPNLTDEYWLHGGSITDIFKTVRYGVPSKGMVSWSGILKPAEMEEVASYIHTLQGSNPPNSKAPQGDKYVVQLTTVSDTTKKVSDTTKVKI